MNIQSDSSSKLYAKVGRTIAKSQYFATPTSITEVDENVEEEI
ncbi:hypothetical protein [Croceivirga sp. JEA036]|nr:hypothetical protein [Croceivirga sp. JEA036]